MRRGFEYDVATVPPVSSRGSRKLVGKEAEHTDGAIATVTSKHLEATEMNYTWREGSRQSSAKSSGAQRFRRSEMNFIRSLAFLLLQKLG